MKYSFLLLVVACTAGLALSKPLQPTKFGELIQSKLDLKRHYKEYLPRDPQDRCTDAYYEYIYNQRFYDCSTFLTEFYYLEDAIEFCDDDCINYLNHADSVIAQACGFPFDNISSQLCDKSDVSGEYCLELWGEAIYNSSLNTLYSDCNRTISNPNVQSCPNSCEQIIGYLTSKLGCCYNYLDITLGDDVLSGRALTLCNFRVPDPCSSRRGRRFK